MHVIKLKVLEERAIGDFQDRGPSRINGARELETIPLLQLIHHVEKDGCIKNLQNQ